VRTRSRVRNRDGRVSCNTLFACDGSMKFTPYQGHHLLHPRSCYIARIEVIRLTSTSTFCCTTEATLRFLQAACEPNDWHDNVFLSCSSCAGREPLKRRKSGQVSNRHRFKESSRPRPHERAYLSPRYSPTRSLTDSRISIHGADGKPDLVERRWSTGDPRSSKRSIRHAHPRWFRAKAGARHCLGFRRRLLQTVIQHDHTVYCQHRI